MRAALSLSRGVAAGELAGGRERAPASRDGRRGAQRFGRLTVLHPTPNAHSHTPAARAVYHAAGIARPALSVTARWASAGRGAGAPTSTPVAGEAKRVTQEQNSAPLRAAAGSERSSTSTSRAAAAAELQGGPAEAAAEPEAGAPSSPLSAHVSPPHGAAARPSAAKAPADEVAASFKHAAAAMVPPGSAATELRGIAGSGAVDAAAGAGSAAASAPTPAAAAASGALTLYVQREGDPVWAEMTVNGSATVAGLTKQVMHELQLKGPLSAVTLHVAQVDEDTDAVLRVEAAALPSRKALAALPALQSGASIVVKVAGTLAVPASAGGELTAALVSPARSPRYRAASSSSSSSSSSSLSSRPRPVSALLTRSQAEPVQPRGAAGIAGCVRAGRGPPPRRAAPAASLPH